jgi:feruloyl esterase
MSKRACVAHVCLLVLFGASAARAQSVGGARLASRDCATLASATLTDTRITSATPVAANPDGSSVAHCKVLGVIGKEIRFQVLLPDDWNGRFFMEGTGGFAGSLEIGGMRYLRLGYAAASTDTGHDASPIQAGWALNNPERVINYGHAAIHRTAHTAKAVIRTYYGRDAERAYFGGCSNGGRQALMEAQRYPDDFDGIVAGAPAYNFTNIAGAFIKNTQAVFPTAGSARTPVVTADNLALVERAALNRCDAADGVRDDVIDRPTTCRFSLDAVKACPGDTAAADCLTRSQRQAIAAIYAPTKAAGKEIYPGQPLGGEHETEGWHQWITGVDEGLLGATNGQASSLQAIFGPEVFKYFVFADPAWDYTKYDLSHWAHDTAAVAPTLNADNPDLSGFKAHHGKLIIWHGWADPALNAVSTIEYYQRVRRQTPAADDFTRLFLLPGVLHCNGGPGPDRVDWITSIVDWVEHGKAPDRVVSKKNRENGQAIRSRPLCPYPQRAVYSGSGSTDDEQNFVCK